MKRVFDHGVFVMGPEIAELERELARFVGSKHCVVNSSGTDALLLAMMALGIRPGDEVITTPFTFFATGEMIELIGAKPIFVDIDPVTFNIDPARIEKAITPKTRAISPVSLYGQCAAFDVINDIAKRHGIPVIEDAAQSFGAKFHNRRSCSLSELSCTSFFPAKPLGCYGDGGACFTDDDGLALAMQEFRNHGQQRRYYHTRIGINGRLDTLQAAVLLAKLEIFEDELRLRDLAAQRYTNLISEMIPAAQVKTPKIESWNFCAWAQYTVVVENRSQIQEALKQKNIPTAVHYPIPLNLQPAFAHLNLPRGTFPNAEWAADRVMSLPMHPYLTEADQTKVVSALRDALRGL